MNKKVTFILLFLAHLLILLGAIYFLPVRYETNDDVVMCLFANGIYSGQPDAHLVFINAIYGAMVAGLYQLTSAVEWYTLFFLLFLLVSITVVVYHILYDDSFSPLVKWCLIPVLYAIWLNTLLNLQFTTVSAWLSFSGCLQLCEEKRGWKVYAIIAIVMASMIRLHAAALVAIIYGANLIYKGALRKDNIKYVIIILACVGLTYMGNKLFYQQKEWREYVQYNELRGRINDNPNAEHLPLDQLPAGIDSADYKLFLAFRPDAQIMNYDMLTQIYAITKKPLSLDQALSNLKKLNIFFIISILLLCLCYISISTARQSWPLLVAFLLVTAVMIRIGVSSLVKYRVFYCMLIPLMVQIGETFSFGQQRLYHVYTHTYKHRYNYVYISAFIILMGLCGGYYLAQNYRTYKHNQEKIREWALYEFPILTKQQGKYITGMVDINNCSPFHLKDISWRIVSLGWATKIPINSVPLQSHLDFVNDDILIITMKNEEPKMLMESITRNYHIPIYCEEVAHSSKYSLYCIRQYESESNVENPLQ